MKRLVLPALVATAVTVLVFRYCRPVRAFAFPLPRDPRMLYADVAVAAQDAARTNWLM